MIEEIEAQENKKLSVLRGELALLVVILINSLGVVLMLYSGSGISAISSVPYAFSEVFTKISLGTWTYIFQGLLVLSLMIMRRKFVAPYLFSFVVGFAFSEMPIIPTDLFPRELADITKVQYSRIKISFDVICLAVTALMTCIILGHLDGLGIGTILAAFSMGKVIGMIGDKMDHHVRFESFMTKKSA